MPFVEENRQNKEGQKMHLIVRKDEWTWMIQSLWFLGSLRYLRFVIWINAQLNLSPISFQYRPQVTLKAPHFPFLTFEPKLVNLLQERFAEFHSIGLNHS